MLIERRGKVMKTSSYYPVLMVDNVATTVEFYCKHFNFTPTFDSDWYVHLQSKEDELVNIAVLQFDHPTVPAGAQAQTNGLILNFEVSDAQVEYDRLRSAGISFLLDIRDEDFGQRHFIAQDPNGVMIDIIQPIPPSAEFAAQYTPATLPQ